MNEERNVFDNISTVCGHGPHVPAAMVKELGGKFTVAGFMVQLLYEAKRNREGRLPLKAGDLFYKTVEEIEEETGIGRWGQETAKKELVKKGWITIVRKGVPARNYFSITRKFNMWNLGMSNDAQKAEIDKLKGGFTANRNNSGEPAFKNEVLPLSRTRENNVLLQRRTTKTTNKEKTSLSFHANAESDSVLFETEVCPKTYKLSTDEFLERWNKCAKRHYFKTHRFFNTSWQKNFDKANKALTTPKQWDEFFAEVKDVMAKYEGTEYVRYFTAGFALRPEKFQDILDDNVRYPLRLDKSVIKKIIEGLKARSQKLAISIQECDAEGRNSERDLKHSKWMLNKQKITQWQEKLEEIK